MKNIILLLTVLISSSVDGQISFDHKLKELAQDLAVRISAQEIKKLAVLNFVDQDDSNPSLADYIGEELSVHLTNDSAGFQVYDRHYMDQLLEEHKLSMSGMIDQSTAKQLGEFSGADALVVGRFSVIDSNVKLWVKVLDTESAMQVAAESKVIALDSFTSAMLTKSGSKPANPTNSDSESSQPNDGQVNSLCFTRANNDLQPRNIFLYRKGTKAAVETLTLARGATSCLYDIEPGVYQVVVQWKDFRGETTTTENYQLNITPTCQLKKTAK